MQPDANQPQLLFTYKKRRIMKNEEKKGNETIEFKNQQQEIDDLNKKVEELEKSLKEETEQREKYQKWWNEGYTEKEELQKTIDDLERKLDKVAAVAELYLKSKIWKR